MMGIMQSWFRAIYEYFYSICYAKIVSFPHTKMAVTVSSTPSHGQIGEGAFSIVLKVKDISSKQMYAMKKMLLQSPEDISMAMNELESLRRFRHNHIIMLIDSQDVIENNVRVMYLLLPYYHRGNLREVLNMTLNGALNRPSIGHILQLFSLICEAVQVLHRFQPSYVHQDIKPEV